MLFLLVVSVVLQIVVLLGVYKTNKNLSCSSIKDKNNTGENILYRGDTVYCAGHGECRVSTNYWGEWGVLDKEDFFIPFHDLIMEQDLGEKVVC